MSSDRVLRFAHRRATAWMLAFGFAWTVVTLRLADQFPELDFWAVALPVTTAFHMALVRQAMAPTDTGPSLFAGTTAFAVTSAFALYFLGLFYLLFIFPMLIACVCAALMGHFLGKLMHEGLVWLMPDTVLLRPIEARMGRAGNGKWSA
jgi:hypothetical protein